MLIQASMKQFRITEPYVCSNTISTEGYPLGQYMGFDKAGIDKLVPRTTWMHLNGQNAIGSRANVFYLDVYKMGVNDDSKCKIDYSAGNQFCYFMSTSKKGNRFAMLVPENANLGEETWSRVFTIIRSSSWAQT